jgi:predicted ATPase/class 3 adenylate cyclase
MATASEATLVFTDIVGSTRLVEQLGDAAAADLWARHDRSVRDLLHRHRGREIDRTDGFFALFDRASDAAAFAVACHDAADALALQARVALHTGAVTLRENDAADVARGAKPVEVEGLAKPFAARLNALAGPGQTLASAAACAALAGASGALRSHGHYRLKGVAEPAEVFELGRGAAPAFSPPADTDKAYRVVRAADGIGGIWKPVREVPNNLPAERDAFIGRAGELDALAARLDAGERLITVLGPGGIGKTRFVRRYARVWLGDWPGGVYFCDLSDARTTDGVLGAVAVGLGIPLGRDDAVTQLGHAIAARGSCLVILDNVEQVLEPVATALSRWLDRAGAARFLVTSRERLRLDGEGVLALEALPLGDDTGGAVALFLARARAQLPGFAANPAQHAEVERVVLLLDGMPLAIELAAARVRLLSPAQIVERLRDRFVLLAGARGTAPRQATLRGAIDWSWELLSRAEQAAFAQCAVFEGGFTLAAAEAVLDLAPVGATEAPIDIVQSLLDKSLLRVWHPRGQGGDHEPRFGMYASLHEYARERLDASGEAAAAEARHGRHFAVFGDEDALAALWKSDGARRRNALAIELDNLVAACRRALARGDAPTAASSYAAAWAVLERQGPRALGVTLGRELATASMPPGPRVVVLRNYGTAIHLAGDPERGAAILLEALALAQSAGDRRAEAELLGGLGDIRFDQMRLDEAHRLLDAALVASRETGDRIIEAKTLCRLTAVAHVQSRWDEAATLMDAGMARVRETGARQLELVLLNMRAMREHAQGHSQTALETHRHMCEIARETGHRSGEATSLTNLGGMLLDLGRDGEALPALQEALSIHREIGNRSHEGMVLGNLGILHRQQGRADDARAHFEAALAIAREVEDPRHELYLLGSLGELLLEQQKFEEAAACFADALGRKAGADDINSGRLLAGMGKLHWRQDRLDEAEQALARGEAFLRNHVDQIELLKLLCTRGQVELARGRRDVALAALAEAEVGAAAMGASPTSILAREIEALRRAIG